MTSDAEFQLRRRADAADRARAFIEDPLLTGAFETLEQRFMLAWRQTSPLDSAGREAIWHHVQALAEVRGELQAVLEDGDLARDQLAEISAGITQP